MKFPTWSKKPRLPISPQKPRQEKATRLVIPKAQTSDRTEFPGNMTAREDVIRLLRGGDLRRKSVAGSLEIDLRNRGIGEKKQEEIGRDDEESTRGDEMKEQRVVVAIFCKPNKLPFFKYFNRIQFFTPKSYHWTTCCCPSTQNLVCNYFFPFYKLSKS